MTSNGLEWLATVGLAAHGHSCNLEVADAAGGQVLADLHGDVAFYDLAAAQAELHSQVERADNLHIALHCASSWRFSKKPGMPRGLMGSTITPIPA